MSASEGDSLAKTTASEGNNLGMVSASKGLETSFSTSKSHLALVCKEEETSTNKPQLTSLCKRDYSAKLSASEEDNLGKISTSKEDSTLAPYRIKAKSRCNTINNSTFMWSGRSVCSISCLKETIASYWLFSIFMVLSITVYLSIGIYI